LFGKCGGNFLGKIGEIDREIDWRYEVLVVGTIVDKSDSARRTYYEK